jgi:hypothetical protein
MPDSWQPKTRPESSGVSSEKVKVWQHDWCLARAPYDFPLFQRFLGLDMAAWNGCSSAAKLGMLLNVPQLTIMHCTCAADLRNLGIYYLCPNLTESQSFRKVQL